jgi:FdhD protein
LPVRADPAESRRDSSLSTVPVCRVSDSGACVESDVVAVEEPLEIRLSFDHHGQQTRTVSVTMRTPGHDAELAVGFLFTEGILTDPAQVVNVHNCGAGNVICVTLRSGITPDLARLERHFYTASSCGVCGKASLDAVRVPSTMRPPAGQPVVDAAIIHRLPDLLRTSQTVFDRTGGLHASALFDVDGNLLDLREDVGRHNALDKLIGSRFLAGSLPLHNLILLLSGRVSFELVQKAAVSGIPMIAAVGAPSSLAIELAREHGLTVLGFVRGGRFNVYSGAERVGQEALPAPFYPITLELHNPSLR